MHSISMSLALALCTSVFVDVHAGVSHSPDAFPATVARYPSGNAAGSTATFAAADHAYYFQAEPAVAEDLTEPGVLEP